MGKIKKDVRVKVWEMFNKRCAYCGCVLKYNEMQVEHINPRFRKSSEEELASYGIIKGENRIENYNPSCRACNSSKGTFTLENWRKEIELKKKRIFRDSSTFRILQRFGLIKLINEPVEFYFEKL